MKNLDRVIVTLAGAPVKDGEKDLTVGAAAAAALLSSNEGDGTKKAERYRLAIKTSAGGEVALTPEELVTIKACVGAFYLPLVVGQVFAWADE